MNRRWTKFSQLKISGEPKPPSIPKGVRVDGGEHRKVSRDPISESGGSVGGGKTADTESAGEDRGESGENY
jgi:hypothetical protein